MALVNAGGTTGAGHPATPNKAKTQNIRVSPAVLDAALKEGEALLQIFADDPGGPDASGGRRARPNHRTE